MNWGSPAAFFAMGGYAFYVWGSFGACALALLIEPLLLNQRRRQAVQALRREALARQLDKEHP